MVSFTRFFRLANIFMRIARRPFSKPCGGGGGGKKKDPCKGTASVGSPLGPKEPKVEKPCNLPCSKKAKGDPCKGTASVGSPLGPKESKVEKPFHLPCSKKAKADPCKGTASVGSPLGPKESKVEKPCRLPCSKKSVSSCKRSPVELCTPCSQKPGSGGRTFDPTKKRICVCLKSQVKRSASPCKAKGRASKPGGKICVSKKSCLSTGPPPCPPPPTRQCGRKGLPHPPPCPVCPGVCPRATGPTCAAGKRKVYPCLGPARFRVTVLGAAGGIGQPLSLLLSRNPLIKKLSLFDVAKVTPGVATDLSHVNTKTSIKGYSSNGLAESLIDSDVVIIPAGMPRKPGMTRDDLFKTNAGIAYQLAIKIAQCCPRALIGVITNPVNATVPIIAETLFQCGVYDPKRLFGITTLDLVRAEKFVATINGCDPALQKVPVIGGHAGATIIPLLSQARPRVLHCLTSAARMQLTKRIQEGGTEVVKAKAGGGSATLSMAYAGARFCNSLLQALAGEQEVLEYAYVRSHLTPACFFSGPIKLGPCGISSVCHYGVIDCTEAHLIEKALPILQKSIRKGAKFARSQFKKR